MKQYSYDGKNRLNEVAFPDGKKESYIYDMFDRVISKEYGKDQFDIQKLNYLYQDANIASEVNVNGDILREIVHEPGIDKPLWTVSDNQSRYYLADQIGSVSTITDSVGNITDKYDYKAFGESEHTENTSDLNEYYGKTEYGFTGRINNEITGLMNYRSRQYDPSIGRFTQYDVNPSEKMYLNSKLIKAESANLYVPELPIADLDQSNNISFGHYTYTEDDPLNSLDPFGTAIIFINYELGRKRGIRPRQMVTYRSWDVYPDRIFCSERFEFFDKDGFDNVLTKIEKRVVKSREDQKKLFLEVKSYNKFLADNRIKYGQWAGGTEDDKTIGISTFVINTHTGFQSIS